MGLEPAVRSAIGALWAAFRPRRSVLVVFALLLGLVGQYFVRLVLAGFTTAWFEDGVPFVILDRAMSLFLTPVNTVLDVLYDPWAPDWVAFALILAYAYALALVVGHAFDRLGRSV